MWLLRVAWCSTRRHPGRFVALTASIALPVLLVLLTAGVYLGLVDAIVAFPRTLGGDVVVAEAGSSPTFMRSSSRLPLDAADRVARLPGVARVDPLHGRLILLERDGRQALVFLVGLYPEETFAAPPAIVAGRARPRLNEIIVDRVLAHDLGLRVGASLRVGPARLRVAGIAEGANAVLGSFAFVHRDALYVAGTVAPSYLFIRGAGRESADVLRSRIAAAPELRAFTREGFLGENVALARQFYRPLIGVIAISASLVGGAILALTLYTATVERRHEYGLLSALGLSRGQVYALTASQAALVTLAGLLVGLSLGRLTGLAIGRVEPRFITALPLWLVGAVAAGGAVVGLVAALLPVRTVARIDPAAVFRV